MSDIEVDQEVDGNPYEEDNAHQTCYVFTPFISDVTEQETPAKKRRKTKHTPEECSSDLLFPLLSHGAEPAAFSHIRYNTFREVWRRKQERIDALVGKTDQENLTSITEFVKSKRTQASNKLQAGLIVCGPDGGAQTRFLERWQFDQGDGKASVVIHLSSSHCVNLQTTLKHIIRNTISSQIGQDGYQKFLNKHKRLIPMAFDLELLQIFVQENSIKHIVLSVLDVETFDISILSELFSVLSTCSESIPVVVLIGVATTIELLESRLPKSTIDLLDATTFTLQSSDVVLQEIVDDLQTDPDQGIKFGPLAISALEELIQSQGTTTTTFTYAIKYAIMSHFFANSLSVLLSTDTRALYADKSLCEAIRHTPSFQAHCESLRSAGKATQLKEASQLLHDDEHLFKTALGAVQSASKSSSFSLPEATTINSHTLSNVFTPRPRHALERALSKPSDYLGCDCCSTADNNTTTKKKTPTPTSTLYTLLQEAGTLINVRDLYDAFVSRQFSRQPPSTNPDEGPTGPDEDESSTQLTQRTQMSTFYTALAELRMLGLVKASSSAGIKKKVLAAGSGATDGSVLGIGGGRGRDRYGDVDFIAKTGWIGL